MLPPVRVLADRLGLNRNTVAAAYRQLAERGVVEGRGRGGTVVASPEPLSGEGARSRVPAVDLAGGNPAPELLPDLRAALAAVGYDPPLYGAPAVLPALRERARDLFSGDVDEPYGLSVTHGALDAIERLLGTALVRGDAVALEDPGYLASTGIVTAMGFRPVGVRIDQRGMDPVALETALQDGARAVVCTSRAQNPTGASIDAEPSRGAQAGPGRASRRVRDRGRPPVARGRLGLRTRPLAPHGTVGAGAVDGQDARPRPARRRRRERSENGGPAAAASRRRRQLGQPSAAGHGCRAARRPRHPAPPGRSACRRTRGGRPASRPSCAATASRPPDRPTASTSGCRSPGTRPSSSTSSPGAGWQVRPGQRLCRRPLPQSRSGAACHDVDAVGAGRSALRRHPRLAVLATLLPTQRKEG